MSQMSVIDYFERISQKVNNDNIDEEKQKIKDILENFDNNDDMSYIRLKHSTERLISLRESGRSIKNFIDFYKNNQDSMPQNLKTLRWFGK
jgi:hypothetical protein